MNLSLYCFIVVIIMSQTKHSFEVRGKSQNLLFICYNAGLIHSVNKSFMFNISYFVIVLLMLCVGFFFFSLRVA